MGAIAESMVAYAQPLIDGTDGSVDQVNRAMSIAQWCWNLALVSGTEQKDMLEEARPAFNMDDAEFVSFLESIVRPMIERHHDMFPDLSPLDTQITEPYPPPQKKYPGTGRNEPCPCHSGKKYKRCCGKM